MNTRLSACKGEHYRQSSERGIQKDMIQEFRSSMNESVVLCVQKLCKVNRVYGNEVKIVIRRFKRRVYLIEHLSKKEARRVPPFHHARENGGVGRPLPSLCMQSEEGCYLCVRTKRERGIDS